MNAPTAMLVEAGSKAVADAIGAALNYGPESFGVKLTSDPAAEGYDADKLGPFPGPITHYGTMAAVLEKPFADEWQAISNGLLPEVLSSGRPWGENGVISYADALAGVTPPGKLQVLQGSDSIDAYTIFWTFVGSWRDPNNPKLRLRKFPEPIFG